jgi:hypothetical protein
LLKCRNLKYQTSTLGKTDSEGQNRLQFENRPVKLLEKKNREGISKKNKIYIFPIIIYINMNIINLLFNDYYILKKNISLFIIVLLY